jgi:broad specificity phosphatase PhoE
MRTQPGQHLSQAGVTLARQVGESMGHFDRVVTSTLPRAFETAIAMGFAVDAQDARLSTMGEGVDAEVHWQSGFAAFARAATQGGATTRFVQEQAMLLRQVVETVPEGGRALVVSHGGILEAGAVGCMPETDHAAWGAACDYCEGIRFTYARGQFSHAEVLRVPGTTLTSA